jgi:acetyl-CoA synthetase
VDFNSYEDFYENFKLRIPDNFNFSYDVIDWYAENEPERPALIWCDDETDDVTFTFAELAKRTNQVANMLKAQGVGRGDSVLLVMKSRHEFWPAILACHKLFAYAIPGTHMLKEHDLTYRFTKGNIKAVMAVESDTLLDEIDLAQKATGDILKVKISISGPRPGWLDYNGEIDKYSTDFQAPPREERNANTDPMLIYFTSGTSGMPKMVAHNYTYALGHILTAKYWQCCEDGGLHYTVADTGWGKAVWGKLYGQWLAGSIVFVYDYDKFDAVNMLKKIQRYKVTTFCAPPTVYRFLIKEDLTHYDLSSIHYAVTAGEPLNPEVFLRFQEKTGLLLREAFGQTELVVTTANWPWMEPKPGSMGKPSPGYKIDLLNSDGLPAEVGDEGEMSLSTTGETLPPGLFIGYHKDPEMTADRWHDGYYHMGDMAWKDEDGYLWFVGRADDVIKTSGYRVGPFEVESVVMQHPAVLECAITGVPDPVRGQVIKSTIVLAKGYEKSEELKKEIQTFVKDNTAPYKYPRIIEFVDTLPKTISGKIRRTEIREQQQKMLHEQQNK